MKLTQHACAPVDRCYGTKEEPAGVQGRYEGILTMHSYKARICRLQQSEPKPITRRQPANASSRAAKAARPKGEATPKMLYAAETSVPTGQKGTALHEATLLRLSVAKGLHTHSLNQDGATDGMYSTHDMTSMTDRGRQASTYMHQSCCHAA